MSPALAAAHALAVVIATQRLGLGFDGEVRVEDPAPLAPGTEGELSLTILERPHAGLAPSVRLSTDAVVLPVTRLGGRDVVDPQAQQPRMRARFYAPAQPGRYEVAGLVEYVTCRDDRCRPRRTRVVWTIEVLEPPAP